MHIETAKIKEIVKGVPYSKLLNQTKSGKGINFQFGIVNTPNFMYGKLEGENTWFMPEPATYQEISDRVILLNPSLAKCYTGPRLLRKSLEIGRKRIFNNHQKMLIEAFDNAGYTITTQVVWGKSYDVKVHIVATHSETVHRFGELLGEIGEIATRLKQYDGMEIKTMRIPIDKGHDTANRITEILNQSHTIGLIDAGTQTIGISPYTRIYYAIANDALGSSMTETSIENRLSRVVLKYDPTIEVLCIIDKNEVDPRVLLNDNGALVIRRVSIETTVIVESAYSPVSWRVNRNSSMNGFIISVTIFYGTQHRIDILCQGLGISPLTIKTEINHGGQSLNIEDATAFHEAHKQALEIAKQLEALLGKQ
jgi:hypothetical protein